MGRITVLADDVVRRIAAGEVIERPASVVKETVENSIDADATRVEVSLEEGGKRRIIVSDDGSGMDADDLKLAVMPHTTSKIRRENDIYRITTLGFRGEALSSIRSVAHLQIRTRMDGSEHGWMIRTNGETIGEVSPCACAKGTTVTVERLFFNLPARRKFLRSEQAETSRSLEVVTKIALCQPNIGFRVTQKGQLLLDCPPSGGIGGRITTLFGEDIGASVLHGKAQHTDSLVEVFVAPPYLSRTDTRMLFTFVNGRAVREETVRKAIRDAFREHLPPQRYPVAFVYLTVPPETIDVNIHPAKERVQLRKPAVAYTAVREAINRALSSVRRFYAPGAPAAMIERQKQIEQALSDYLRKQPLARRQKHLDIEFRPLRRDEEGEAGIPEGRFMVLHNAYILLETENGFIVVDQHALHERLVYDRLRVLVATEGLRLQRLLVPVEVETDSVEMSVFKYNRNLFKSLGIEVEARETRLLIHSIPEIGIDANEWSDIVHEVLSNMIQQPDTKGEGRLEGALKTLACRAAVKAGEPLSNQEISGLLAEARRCHIPATCPHGRPILKRFSLSEVERWFKR